MTDSRPPSPNTLLEQLAAAMEDDRQDAEGWARLRQMVSGMMAQTRSWDDEFRKGVIDAFGEVLGAVNSKLYANAFPPGYRARFSSATAVRDIAELQSIAVSADVPMHFHTDREQDGNTLSFKLYSSGKPVILSDVVPLLENLGMRVLDEHPYVIERSDGKIFGISDFTVEVLGEQGTAGSDTTKALLQEAFREIWNGFAENDTFNRLILVAGLGWREVVVLRAYARYIKQLRFGFSQQFLAETLAKHRDLTAQLIELFRVRFQPDSAARKRRKQEADVEKAILTALEGVESLDDDRILRRFYVLIKATSRTNFFQQEDGQAKPYVSFKIDPQMIPDIPRPCPRFEIFVYSPRVEGVHLRAGPVARGGLRWSDRAEDYRTEILGLMKAQQVKNSVIVPVGAKGGFIVKQPPADPSRAALQEEGIACYQTFIRGLLDLTDNLDGGVIVPPKALVRHDDDDPYLVVAADKGTATFSDIANRLAGDYGFWLGDAFASGGSEGYDHKKMGITARGAWESVKRHFLEKGIDTQSDPFTVVGIGDMGGDVFGNGMLLSDQIRLVGAFNHLHILVDPKPDAAVAFAERQRLFELPGSSWADYDASKISAGGGVFPRSMKSIPVTKQMARALGIKTGRLTPNELISALLKAPVDMIWNGGIGTYAKAPGESHEEVGDKANDPVRVDSNQLRCRVLGEGGNLGFTQRARIDFARRGGAANTDFIDNAGGVDCSDHEVNMKILLNTQVRDGALTREQRNRMLREMTPEVAQLVLKNNYRQAMALSIADAGGMAGLDECERLIRRLESDGQLDRALEFLPDEETLQERRERGTGLTRPELAVLISYAKLELEQSLQASPRVLDDRFSDALFSAFPASMRDAFPDAIRNHPLRADITATQLANDLVNRMGITWIDRIRHAARADVDEVVIAYRIAMRIYGVDAQWAAVEQLDGRIRSGVQLELFRDLIRLITRSATWILRNRPEGLDAAACQARYSPLLAEVVTSVEALQAVIPESRWKERYAYYVDNAVPDSLAAICASIESRYWLLDIIEVARQFDQPLTAVAEVYFSLGEGLKLTWLDRQMRAFRAKGHWQSLATSHYRDELDYQLRNLTASVFRSNDHAGTPQQLLDVWHTVKRTQIQRWQQMQADMQATEIIDCAVFSVAHGVLRELGSEVA
ncbi:NAD-glutamate dehydrogenase [Marinobacter halodurans]|uniref:NAD-glutamate dehydrogenase n=1 Tax=Marinobacter halodurans TaxID=2528979 RepID=A0ABY1ZMS8_9GAMM|nr:NAD-glutamate dehydrogenase domain-containing protein [Marinobacter halodurans]TBW55708.1 NAD-glutamate dehydrogenase [Marinobacter halodurans]